MMIGFIRLFVGLTLLLAVTCPQALQVFSIVAFSNQGLAVIGLLLAAILAFVFAVLPTLKFRVRYLFVPFELKRLYRGDRCRTAGLQRKNFHRRMYGLARPCREVLYYVLLVCEPVWDWIRNTILSEKRQEARR